MAPSSPYRTPSPPVPTPTKWKVCFIWGEYPRNSAHVATTNILGVIIGCVFRLSWIPSFRSLLINGTVALVFALLWVGLFLRVRKVPAVVPTGSYSTP